MTAHSGARRWTSALLLGFAVGVATGWSLPLGDDLAGDESTLTAEAASLVDEATPLPQTAPSSDVDGAVDVDPEPKREARSHSLELAGKSSVVADDDFLLLLCD